MKKAKNQRSFSIIKLRLVKVISFIKASKNNLPDDYEILVARTAKGIDAIRKIWENMQSHPNSDIDFYLSVIKSRQNIISPYVMLLKHNGLPITLLLGRVENYPFSLNFGYKTIYTLNIRTLIIIYEGILGDNSYENCHLLFNELLHSFHNEKINLIFLSSLKNNSNFYNIYTEVNYFFRDHVPVPNSHWRMAMPDNMDEFYKMRSRKHRYWLRRITKVLDKDFMGNTQIKVFFKKDDVDTLCNDVEQVASKTYHRGLGAGFIDSIETRKMFAHLTEKSKLRAYILYINDKPSAFWIGRQYNNTFYLAYTGYLREFEKYELGTILFLKMLEDLCATKKNNYIDFGFGDAPYKKRFGDTNWQESSVYIFPHTLGGLLLNVARTITALGYQLSIGTLKRFNLLEKVKKIWRRRLAKGTVRNSRNNEINQGTKNDSIGK